MATSFIIKHSKFWLLRSKRSLTGQIRSRSDAGNAEIGSRGISVWNALPDELISRRSLRNYSKICVSVGVYGGDFFFAPLVLSFIFVSAFAACLLCLFSNRSVSHLRLSASRSLILLVCLTLFAFCLHSRSTSKTRCLRWLRFVRSLAAEFPNPLRFLHWVGRRCGVHRQSTKFANLVMTGNSDQLCHRTVSVILSLRPPYWIFWSLAMRCTDCRPLEDARRRFAAAAPWWKTVVLAGRATIGKTDGGDRQA